MDSLAKTADEFLLASIQRLQDLGSRITDFTAGGAGRTFTESLSAALALQSQVAEQLRQDSYLATATGDALDMKAADFQVARKASVPALGTIRLTRGSTATAINVPAGWAPLLTAPATGQTPVAFVSTEAAVFGIGESYKVVAAAAVEGGTAGNIPINTKLLPQNPLLTFDTDGGFKAEAAFTGGVDVETDDQLRARVPIEVQGRVKGTPPAFLAAALRVPGVTSASVLEAGDTRLSPGTGNVPDGQVEVYFKGSSSLLTQVTTQCESARVAGQSVVVAAATGVALTVDLTVTTLAGTDTTALASAVKAAVVAAVDLVGVDEILRASSAVKTVHDLANVVGVNVPFQDLRKTSALDNTFGDVACGNVAYPTLALANVAVTVNTL